MERSLIAAPADLVRRAIAGAAAGPGPDPPLGGVSLHAHQREAVRLVRQAFGEFGGALLADAVGLGKTYVALALAADLERTLVVAPAALRDMWRAAAARAGQRTLGFVSFEQLSRGESAPAAEIDLLVVDEAHHARNPATTRYRRLAALAAGRAPVLLLSATPVHNAAADLAALLALFLGARAQRLGPAELARCVVRRGAVDGSEGGSPAVPRVAAAEWVAVGDRGDVLAAIVALPPPLPPADGGDGGALLTQGLVRQWASSDGALRGALRRRLAAAVALGDSLARGRLPTRAELASWSHADGVVQLGFAELLAAGAPPATAAGAREAVAAHAAAVRALLQRLDAGPSLDARRAAALRALRRRHPGERIVAFSAYADTVAALARELRRDAGVAALSAGGARVAGGRLTRREALQRFAPRASGVRAPSAADAIELLLTTDLLSEGVNLQDASVVVHLDLPWTAARLEQRVGRVARLGSRSATVAVYALAPPASAARLADAERAIRRKLAAARLTVGAAGAILPATLDCALLDPPPAAAAAEHGADSAADTAAAVRALLARWRAAGAPGEPADPEARGATLVAAVAAPHDGFVARLDVDGRETLLAAFGGSSGGSSGGSRGAAPAGEAPALVLGALRAAGDRGGDAALDPPAAAAAARRALGAIEDWHARRAAERAAGVVGGIGVGARRRVVERIAAITRRAGAHERPLLAPLAAAARRASALSCGAGGERVLGELAGAVAMADAAWLRAVASFAAVHGRTAPAPPPGLAVRALLLLVPPSARDPDSR